ncbi:MAG: phage integrase SAM-like domain-containing protein [Clostridiales bacterium]|nr:phage integrase SAM-like domain-containing protein [Clostridiales bacterium]
MASITKKPNGSYVIRIQTGKKITGGYSSISKVFWPSKPNLSYASLQRELNMFVDSLELQILNGDISSPNSVPIDQKKTLFEDFCKLFLEIKKAELSPGTIEFYKKIINQHLIPTYGKMHMNEFAIRHVQDYIQFIINKGRQDFHGYGKPMSAATVKRYATVFRSILSLAYKMEYMDIVYIHLGEFVKEVSNRTGATIQKYIDKLKIMNDYFKCYGGFVNH